MGFIKSAFLPMQHQSASDFFAGFLVAVEVFLEQEDHDYQLGNFRGNGTKLIRSLVGTTAQSATFFSAAGS